MIDTNISQNNIDTESMLIFASSCIESCARKLNVSSGDMYVRMKNVGLINNYILKHYDTLHTESRRNVTEDVLECLTNWEATKSQGKEDGQ